MTDLSTPTLTALDEDRTPGKWGVERTYGDTYIGPMKRDIQSLAFAVASFETHQGVADHAVTRNLANARLCALAPALLAEVLESRKRIAELEAFARNIRDVEQGCGGNLRPSECVRSAVAQATAILQKGKDNG